jgi:hypothetical protein
MAQSSLLLKKQLYDLTKNPMEGKLLLKKVSLPVYKMKTFTNGK